MNREEDLLMNTNSRKTVKILRMHEATFRPTLINLWKGPGYEASVLCYFESNGGWQSFSMMYHHTLRNGGHWNGGHWNGGHWNA